MLKETTIPDFDSKTTKYSLKNAVRLCEASALAYKPEQEIKSFAEIEWGLPKFKFFDISHTQAFMAANDEMIILAFRGTESIQDWITDAKVKLDRKIGENRCLSLFSFKKRGNKVSHFKF